MTFDDVTFRYPGADRDAVAHVSLTVPAGGHLALVGATGSGKTTLSSLVPRLHDVTSGAVRIDGVDVLDVTLADLAAAVPLIVEAAERLLARVHAGELAAPPASADELTDARIGWL